MNVNPSRWNLTGTMFRVIRRILVRTRTPLRGVSRGYVHGFESNTSEPEPEQSSGNRDIVQGKTMRR